MKTLSNLYSLPSIIRVTESLQIMRWAGNIACTEDNKFKKNVGKERRNEDTNSEDLGFDGST